MVVLNQDAGESGLGGSLYVGRRVVPEAISLDFLQDGYLLGGHMVGTVDCGEGDANLVENLGVGVVGIHVQTRRDGAHDVYLVTPGVVVTGDLADLWVISESPPKVEGIDAVRD